MIKLTWRDRIKSKIAMFLYKRIGVKSGPFMFYSLEEWFFIDSYGNIYNIKYIGQYDIPLSISVFHKR